MPLSATFLLHGAFDHADAVDLATNDIAALEETLRLHADPDSLGGAGRDQIAGLDYLKALPFTDLGRVAIHGHSYGGTMTVLAMLKAPDRFHVGVAGAPVTDWRLYDTCYSERFMGLLDPCRCGYRAS